MEEITPFEKLIIENHFLGISKTKITLENNIFTIILINLGITL